MMRRKLSQLYFFAGVALVAWLVAGASPEAAAQQESEVQQSPPACREASAGGPEDVVRTLYRVYPAGDEKKVLIFEPKKILLEYFDEKPAALLVQIRQCGKRTGDDCGPGYDLMYDSNAGEISDLQICAMDQGNKTVMVRFRDAGDPKVVTYKLTHKSAGWRIADILYSHKPDNPYGGSMVKLLAALLADEESH